jgi:hypothetical protein
MRFLRRPSRLICAGLCLAGVSPAAIPMAALPEPLPPGPAVAAATRPAKAPAAPAEDAEHWLHRRLAETGAQADDLPVKVTQPIRPPRDAAIPVPFRPWLPPPAVPAEPRLARGDREHALRPRPAVDVPPLALDLTPAVPTAVVLPAYTPPRIASPDPARTPIASLSGRGNVDRPKTADDPTAEAASPAALAVTPPARSKPAPPLLLTIPDPSGPAAGATVPVTDAPEDRPVTYAGPVPGMPKLSQK